VQGEGVYSGTPSVFLRTYHCNLSCTWCDSKYTWLDQDKSKAGVEYVPMSTATILEKVTGYECKHLVLTGGEPLLHQRSALPVLASLKKWGFFIEVETNGTLAPMPEFVKLIDCFNVSPKISNSLVEAKVRVRPAALREFAKLDKAWFKFVVCDEADIAEVEEMVAKFGMRRDRVILMPEGIDATTVLARSRWLVEACKEKGFRFTPRLQILLYGNTRGT